MVKKIEKGLEKWDAAVGDATDIYIYNNSMRVWSNRVITSQTTCYNTGYCKNKIWKSISVPFPIKYLSIRFSLSNFSSFSSSELSPKPRSNTNAAPCFRDYRMKRKEQYHTKQWAFCSLCIFCTLAQEYIMFICTAMYFVYNNMRQ